MSRLISVPRCCMLALFLGLAALLMACVAFYASLQPPSAAAPPPATAAVVANRPSCPQVPLGGFYDVWRNDQVWPRLGCATAPAEAVSGTEAYLDCFHSVWLSEKRQFVAISYGQKWQFVDDESGLPPDTPLMVEPAPRPQPYFPATGRHGWLVRSAAFASTCGGGAKGGEAAFNGALQPFEDGWLLWNGNVAFVLFADGTWILF